MSWYSITSDLSVPYRRYVLAGTYGTYGTWRTSLYLTSMCLDSPDSPENRPETVAVLGMVRFDTGPKR